MRIGKVVFCIVASVTCAAGAIAYADDAIREIRRDRAWDKAIQEELGPKAETDEMQEGQHISDSE